MVHSAKKLGNTMDKFLIQYSVIIILYLVIFRDWASLTLRITQLLSCVQLSATSWTLAHQAPLFMGFFRQEYWSGLPFPPPGDLPDPGFELVSPVSPALQLDSLPTEPSRKPLNKAKSQPKQMYRTRPLTQTSQKPSCLSSPSQPHFQRGH